MHRNAAGYLAAGVVVAEARVRERAGCDRRREVHEIVGDVGLHSRIPAERGDERHARSVRGPTTEPEYVASHPRPRICSSSSALAGTASARIEVRY